MPALAYSVSLKSIEAIFGGRKSFTPSSLFAASEPGGWYDPSDLTTLYQDAAGTTPVTAVEQPVGLVLDKRTGSVGTNGAKRVNVLIRTEEFNATAWPKFDTTVSANTTATTDPIGGNNADALLETATTAAHYFRQELIYTNASYTASIYIKANGRTKGNLALYVASPFTGGDVTFDLTAKTATASSFGSGSFSTATLTELSNGWFLLKLVGTMGGTGLGYFQLQIMPDSGSPSYLGDTSKGFYLYGADLRLTSEANTSPAYQRITADWPSTMSGSHLSQSTSTARPVLSARVNLLTYSEDFRNTAAAGETRPWTWAKASISANAINAPNGTLTADKLVEDNTSGLHQVYHSVNASSGQTFSIYAKSAERSVLGIYSGAWFSFNLSSGVATGSGATITSVGDGWYQCAVPVSATTQIFFGPATQTVTNDTTWAYAGNGTSGIYIWGADLRPANTGVGLPAYQRVGAATAGSSTAAGNADYDTTGFPLYLKFDGVDDVLAAPDSSGLRQSTMSFWAGVNPLALGSREDWFANGDANAFSTNNWIFGNGTSQINLFPRTPASIQSLGAVSANTAFVVYAGYDGSSVSPRLNTTAGTSISATLGTDNTSGFFVGSSKTAGVFSYYSAMHLYSLIVRGAATDAATITATETWVNGKTKAF